MKTREDVLQEALPIALRYTRTSLAISMRVGKTKIGLTYLNEKSKGVPGFKALIVYPRLSIKNSWEKEMKEWNMEHLKPFISYSTYLSLHKQKVNEYDVIILDECHSLKAGHLGYLDSHKGAILGLTGTPPKYQRGEKYQMMARFCPVRYEYLVKEATEDKIVNDYTIYVHKLALSKERNMEVKIKKNGEIINSFYTSEQLNYEFYTNKIQEQGGKTFMTTMRLNALKGYSTKIKYVLNNLSELQGYKTLIFVNTKEQADLVASHSYYSGNVTNDKDLEAFQNGEINVLSSVLQLAEGITIKDLDTVIITHSYGNEYKLPQRLARALSLSSEKHANVHILCYKDTVDEIWVMRSLEDFDPSKIRIIECL